MCVFTDTHVAQSLRPLTSVTMKMACSGANKGHTITAGQQPMLLKQVPALLIWLLLGRPLPLHPNSDKMHPQEPHQRRIIQRRSLS